MIGMAILFTVVLTWPIPLPTPGLSAENFQRLHIGMGEKEIEAILGQPRWSSQAASHFPDGRIIHKGSIFQEWYKDGHFVGIIFCSFEGAVSGGMMTKDGKHIKLRESPKHWLE